MATCYHCGGEIEFRHIDGVLRPIHLSGGFCEGRTQQDRPRSRGWTHDSYLVPNASCPVCGEAVFFYQSPHGGRVFFDDVGWPWPKHGCTDTRQNSARSPQSTNRNSVFRDKSGARLKIYDLDDIEQRGDCFVLVLRNQLNGYRIRLEASKTWLKRSDVRLADFQDAPSFVVHEFERGVTHIRLDFVCARLGKILRMKLKVTH